MFASSSVNDAITCAACTRVEIAASESVGTVARSLLLIGDRLCAKMIKVDLMSRHVSLLRWTRLSRRWNSHFGRTEIASRDPA